MAMAEAEAEAEALAVGLTDPSEGFEVWGDFSSALALGS